MCAVRALGWRYILCGSLPLVAGWLFAVLRLVGGWETALPLFVRYFVFFLSFALLCAFCPGRYLRERNRQPGAFLPSLLLLLVVLPLCALLLVGLSDALCALTLGRLAGAPALPAFFSALGGMLQSVSAETGLSLPSSPLLLWYVLWVLFSLVFAAGALGFESDSVMKSLFVLFTLSVLLFLLLALVVGRIPVGSVGLEQLSVELSARRLALRVRLVTDVFLALQAAVCIWIIYRHSRV